MIDFETHKNKLEGALCVKNPSTNKNCIDKIEEKLWVDNVMYALNDFSLKAADELQEPGKFYPKTSFIHPGVKTDDELQKILGTLKPEDIRYKGLNDLFIGVCRKQKYSEAPPTRLLSMTLVLSYFLGFLDASGDHEMHEEALGARERIIQAYDKGKASHPKSKSGLSK